MDYSNSTEPMFYYVQVHPESLMIEILYSAPTPYSPEHIQVPSDVNGCDANLIKAIHDEVTGEIKIIQRPD